MRNLARFSFAILYLREQVQQATHSPMVPQANTNFARVFNAGYNIGIDRTTGNATSIYTVITNALGELVTAYPGL